MPDARMLHMLPVEAYLSQDWFDREQSLIFSKVWRYAGFAEDLANPGDYITVQAGLNNILIVKADDGELRAFHNICRHRGTQLLRAVGKTVKAITCPYHDWTYDLNGNLVAVPEEASEFANLDKSCLGLKPASVGIWRSMIFVHPSPSAPPLKEWFRDIEPHLGPHRPEELVEYKEAATKHEIAANWKIVVENYIDIYHLAHLHSGTLSMYDHRKATFGFHGPHFAFQEPLTEDYFKDIQKNTPMPLVIAQDNLGAWVPMLFPGLGLTETESSWSTFIITPVKPDHTIVETRTRVKNASSWEFVKQEWRSYSYWKDRISPKYASDHSSENGDALASGDFMAEDVFVCEQQQKSLRSPYFEVGPSAVRSELPIIEHQKVVRSYLGMEPLNNEGQFNYGEGNLESETVDTVSAAQVSEAEITLNGQTVSLDISSSQTVLEALKTQGMQPPHSCETGVCGTCRAMRIEGDLDMRVRSALSDEEVADGYVLTCQARPVSERIKLSYDI